MNLLVFVLLLLLFFLSLYVCVCGYDFFPSICLFERAPSLWTDDFFPSCFLLVGFFMAHWILCTKLSILTIFGVLCTAWMYTHIYSIYVCTYIDSTKSGVYNGAVYNIRFGVFLLLSEAKSTEWTYFVERHLTTREAQWAPYVNVFWMLTVHLYQKIHGFFSFGPCAARSKPFFIDMLLESKAAW